VIRVERLCKTYQVPGGRATPALVEVDLTVAAGDLVAVMGPSGSGKSTFLNILGCLDVPTAGAYWLAGRNVAALDGDELARTRNREIGFVFQGFNLLRRVNARDNVALPLLYAGVGPGERRRRAEALLADLGIGDLAASLPSQMSGGQQQRVAIARALACEPRLLLADEPTGNLDSHTSEEVMGVLTRLNAERGITIVLVTHEPDIARYARRLVRFVDGRVVHDGVLT